MTTMTRVSVLFALIFSLLSSASFSQARDAFVQFNQRSCASFFVEIPAGSRVVTSLLEQQLLSEDVKIKQDKEGWYRINKIKIPQLGSEYMDIYYKLVETDVNQLKVTQLSFLVSKGYDNFVNSSIDPVTGFSVTKFLNRILRNVQRMNLQSEVNAQLKLLENEKATTVNISNNVGRLEQERRSLDNRIVQLEVDRKNQLQIEKEAEEKLMKLRQKLVEFEEANKDE